LDIVQKVWAPLKKLFAPAGYGPGFNPSDTCTGLERKQLPPSTDAVRPSQWPPMLPAMQRCCLQKPCS